MEEKSYNLDYEITKLMKIYEVNNDMVHNYYYVAYGKILNKDHTRCRKFKFVVWFDTFDVMECFNKDRVSIKDIKDYASNLVWNNSYLLNINNYDDTKHLKEFYDYCKETIDNYNKII